MLGWVVSTAEFCRRATTYSSSLYMDGRDVVSIELVARAVLRFPSESLAFHSANICSKAGGPGLSETRMAGTLEDDLDRSDDHGSSPLLQEVWLQLGLSGVCVCVWGGAGGFR